MGLRAKSVPYSALDSLEKFRKGQFPAWSVAAPGACSSLCLTLGDPRAACSPTPGGLHATWSHSCPLCLLLLGAGVLNTSVAQSLCPANSPGGGGGEVLQYLSSLLVTHQPLLNK